MSAATPARRPLSILVVDDEAINVAILRRLLGRCGFDCEIARDGAEAVERASAAPCDLVLMDICMPVMDGVAAAGEIGRRLGPLRPAIVAVTANATDEQRRLCDAAGFAGFIPKPVRLDALRAALDEVGAACG